MKHLHLLILLSVLGLYSCGSSNHFNNNSIQKKKYKKGWSFNKMKQSQTAKNETSDVKLSPKGKKQLDFELVKKEVETISITTSDLEKTVAHDLEITNSLQEEKIVSSVELKTEDEVNVSIIPNEIKAENNRNTETVQVVPVSNSDAKISKNPKGARVNRKGKIVLVLILIGLVAVYTVIGAGVLIVFMGGIMTVVGIVGGLGVFALLVQWVRNLFRRENSTLNKKRKGTI